MAKHRISKLARDKQRARDLLFLQVADAEHFPGEVDVPSPHFACFLAWDAAGVPVHTVSRVVESLLRSGCVCLCAWGSDCERVHDVFDETWVMSLLDAGVDVGAEDTPTIDTTWHADEPIDEGLWYFLFTMTPDDPYQDTCRAWLAIVIGEQEDRLRRTRYAMSRPSRFSAGMLDDSDS